MSNQTRPENPARRVWLKGVVGGTGLLLVEGALATRRTSSEGQKKLSESLQNLGRFFGLNSRVTEAAQLADTPRFPVMSINQAPEGQWFLPEGESWFRGIRKPGLGGTTKVTSNGIGNITLSGDNGSGFVGVDFDFQGKYLAQVSGGQDGVAYFIKGAKKGAQIIIQDAEDNILGTLNANEAGEAALKVSQAKDLIVKVRVETDGELEINQSPYTNEGLTETGFDKFSTDISFLDPEVNTTQVVEAEASAQQTQKNDNEDQDNPEFLEPLPVFSVAEAPPNVKFNLKTRDGEFWSKYVEMRKHELPEGATLTDTGNVGEFWALMRGAGYVDFDIETNPLHYGDIQQGQAFGVLWMNLQPGAMITFHGQDGMALGFQQGDQFIERRVVADGRGTAGIILPDYRTLLRMRVTMKNPSEYSDNRFGFGPGKQEDKNLPHVIDTRDFLPPVEGSSVGTPLTNTVETTEPQSAPTQPEAVTTPEDSPAFKFEEAPVGVWFKPKKANGDEDFSGFAVRIEKQVANTPETPNRVTFSSPLDPHEGVGNIHLLAGANEFNLSVRIEDAALLERIFGSSPAVSFKAKQGDAKLEVRNESNEKRAEARASEDGWVSAKFQLVDGLAAKFHYVQPNQDGEETIKIYFGKANPEAADSTALVSQ